jgi:hypothetical protein
VRNGDRAPWQRSLIATKVLSLQGKRTQGRVQLVLPAERDVYLMLTDRRRLHHQTTTDRAPEQSIHAHCGRRGYQRGAPTDAVHCP